MKFYDDNTTGTILQFLQEDVTQAGQLFPKIITEMVFMGLIRFLIIAFFLMWIDIKITFIMLMLYIVGLIITLFFNRKTLQPIQDIRKINMELYMYIHEGIEAFLTIKTLNIFKRKEKELEEKLEEYNKTKETLEKSVTAYHTIFAFLTSLTTVVILYYGGINMLHGLASYAEIMILLDYKESLQHNFSWFIQHITNVGKAMISYSKILEFIHLDQVEDLKKGISLQNIKTIEFDHVSFSYENKIKNIENFCFYLEEKKHIAVIGKTGSGKTTISNLLCRFYEPTQGRILINGRDYTEYSIESLRKKIGYVLQEVQIIPNTILDNIRYVNPNISLKEVEMIFQRLNLHEKIMSFKNSYDTDIYHNPDLLSTGEKQLINFARIMAVNPDMIILDEVTSSLSYESEVLVKHAIEEIAKDKIVWMISHRLSVIKQCDVIIVMKDGKIQETGSHTQLLERQGMYYQLLQAKKRQNTALLHK